VDTGAAKGSQNEEARRSEAKKAEAIGPKGRYGVRFLGMGQLDPRPPTRRSGGAV